MQVLRCVRPDRVAVQMTRYVSISLGERYVQPPTVDFNNIYAQSSELGPIVFILSPGADPAFDIFRLGEIPLRVAIQT
jgi:dynein heavy chain, axonemal